jgi:ABC-type uncharacterized transport system permease subunit
LRVRLVERAPWERRHTLLYGVLGLAVGLLLCVAVGALTPIGVVSVARALFRAFTSPSQYVDSLPFYTPIALSAAGLVIAYRAGFITIGAEGQVILGAVLTYGLLIFYMPHAGRAEGITIALLLALLVGAVYGGTVGVLRAYLGANETLVSLMMNFIAIAVANYLISGPWKLGAMVITPRIPGKFLLSPYTAALAATTAIVALQLMYNYTRLGVASDAAGTSRLAAETYGISVRRVYVLVSLVSGAAAGLGGALYALSINTPLTSIGKGGLGFGYTGILGAWLAGLNILGSIGAGLLLGLLYNMATTLQLWGMSPSTVYTFESILVLTVLLFTTLARYRVVVEK